MPNLVKITYLDFVLIALRVIPEGIREGPSGLLMFWCSSVRVPCAILQRGTMLSTQLLLDVVVRQRSVQTHKGLGSVGRQTAFAFLVRSTSGSYRHPITLWPFNCC